MIGDKMMPREDQGDQMKTGGQKMTGDQIDDLATLMNGDQRKSREEGGGPDR